MDEVFFGRSRWLGDALDPDAILSSLRPALATGRSVRLADHGRQCSCRSDQASKFPIEGPAGPGVRRRIGSRGLRLFCVLLAASAAYLMSDQRSLPVLGSSDSLRLASRAIVENLPAESKRLAVYARPPLLYYLAAQRVAVYRSPDLASLLGSKDPAVWALIDLALIPKEQNADPEINRLLAGWTVVGQAETALNAPTLLDINPLAVRSPIIEVSVPLRLLRRKTSETAR